MLYELLVEGELGKDGADWFEGVAIKPDAPGLSLLVADLPDQAALHGLLHRLRDLGLPIVSVRRSDEADPASGTGRGKTMLAMVSRRYGLRGLRLGELPRPSPREDKVLVRIHATSLNFAMLGRVTGRPLLLRLLPGCLWKPRWPIPGGELAGVVVEAGPGTRRFRPGDEVMGDNCGAGYGASAQYLCVAEAALARKPSGLSFEEAAALPQSGLVALQALRAGGVAGGTRVLVHGASGGIGTLAVQIARALGARVTALCSGRNLELVKALGAEAVIDYTKEGLAACEDAFDVILGIRGGRPLRDYARALAPGGAFVLVGGSWLQVLEAMTRGQGLLAAEGKRLGRFTYRVSSDDLAFLGRLVEAGKLRPVIDSVRPLSGLAEALRHFRRGHVRGKVVIAIPQSGLPETDASHIIPQEES